MKNHKQELLKKNEGDLFFSPGWSSFFPSLLDERDLDAFGFHENSGVSLSEDGSQVYVEAALPGIAPEDIELNYDKGVLLIKADKKEEESDKNRKFYRKAHRHFFYQVAIPGKIDDSKLPEAICKDGVLKVGFAKKGDEKSRKEKINVKRG